jgi:hypothetical protein
MSLSLLAQAHSHDRDHPLVGESTQAIDFFPETLPPDVVITTNVVAINVT